MQPPTKACFNIGLASRKQSRWKIESVMDLAFSKMPSFHWPLARLPRSLTFYPSLCPRLLIYPSFKGTFQSIGGFTAWKIGCVDACPTPRQTCGECDMSYPQRLAAVLRGLFIRSPIPSSQKENLAPSAFPRAGTYVGSRYLK